MIRLHTREPGTTHPYGTEGPGYGYQYDQKGQSVQQQQSLVLCGIRHGFLTERKACMDQPDGQQHTDEMFHGEKTVEGIFHDRSKPDLPDQFQSKLTGDPLIQSHQQHEMRRDEQEKSDLPVCRPIRTVAVGKAAV